jgi:hypothetical protein
MPSSAPVPVRRVADQRFAFLSDGRTLRMPLFSTGALLVAHPGVTRLVIVINGTLRNADVYHESAVAAAHAAGAAARDVLIVTPQFLAVPDAEAFRLDDDVPYWRAEGWKIGDRSIQPAQGPSSYAVIDAILAAALDRDRFPALRTVVVAGHSAGGQFVQRYIAFNPVHTSLRGAGLDVRYVVANPSSYFYFDERRLNDDGVLAPYPRDRCMDFNKYRYGVEQPNHYAAAAFLSYGGASAPRLAQEYGSRTVAYFLGEADADPDSDSMDKSCAAAAQGATRLERGQRYFRYMQALLGPAVLATHSLHIVPGVGHDHRAMFLSPCGLSLLYGDGRCHSHNFT